MTGESNFKANIFSRFRIRHLCTLLGHYGQSFSIGCMTFQLIFYFVKFDVFELFMKLGVESINFSLSYPQIHSSDFSKD